ncbi:MAG: transposase [Spirochaetaceae bacterium]|jgi:REP element-mobilizing transposase RayT|nr:transposase [Spirochaetaceae bacterium]
MRPLRVLQSGVWYEIRTRINNREPLFRRHRALAIFERVFRETKERFMFQSRGLQLADDGLRFYIKPAEGLQLPAIMKWMKQVFAQRYNRAEGREGHIWGDRYGSRILAGEPPTHCDGDMTGDCGAGDTSKKRVRPCCGEAPYHSSFAPPFPLPLLPSPG